MRRDVFQAIADPTRRRIIDMLAKGPLTLNGVASNFEMARPSVSKHVRILRECGLISVKRQGRERYCTARLRGLREVAQWANYYRVFWDKKLGALKRFVEENP
ncbi:MAG: metalloregulator ArsR/SmtB family transcription factor [Spirochaetia bacterium]|nr:metalloregulator ArsR/SmtB family transcription factor [Spirochaetia bacterium]